MGDSARDSLYEKLKGAAFDGGAQLFGAAKIDTADSLLKVSFLPEAEGLGGALSIGVRLSLDILEGIVDHPTRLYYHHYRTVNACLDQIALRLAVILQEAGFRALPIPASQIVDWQLQRAHVSHKRIGYLAGLGWIGRNNLLVNPRLGSQFRLASVLTDASWVESRPFAGGCGACHACVGACPAGAIKERPEDFDHQRCFNQLREFQKKRLVDQYICGICQKACAAPPRTLGGDSKFFSVRGAAS